MSLEDANAFIAMVMDNEQLETQLTDGTNTVWTALGAQNAKTFTGAEIDQALIEYMQGRGCEGAPFICVVL